MMSQTFDVYEARREEFFHVLVQVMTTGEAQYVGAIDPKSQTNLISEAMVKMGLVTTP